MTVVHRVLPPAPVRSLDEHLQRRGGRGIDVALSVEPEAIIDELGTNVDFVRADVTSPEDIGYTLSSWLR